MALARRYTSGASTSNQAVVAAEPARALVARRLIMTAEDMPRFGSHEPGGTRAPAWVRLMVVLGGTALCWGLIWIAAALL